MKVLTLHTEDDQWFCLPVNRIQFVQQFQCGNTWLVRIYHDSTFFNPLVYYRGDSKEEAARIFSLIQESLENA